MQLTKKASYGLILMLELARLPSEETLSAAAVAERCSLPPPFVEKILHRLRIAGLVESRQGRAGGYRLCVPADGLSVRRVLESLGEPIDLVPCLGEEPRCDLVAICPTKKAWTRINARLSELLESLSVGDLLRD
jgi:Rrf2 family protein